MRTMLAAVALWLAIWSAAALIFWAMLIVLRDVTPALAYALLTVWAVAWMCAAARPRRS